MKIVIDSREQRPFSFAGELYQKHGVVTDRVAVERKSLPDLVQCLGRERDRFERELQRGAALGAFSVAVEASWADLASGNYRSQLKPHAACQSVAAFMARYRVPFIFAGSRAAAEYVTWSFLRQYLEGARRRWKAIVRAHGDVA